MRINDLLIEQRIDEKPMGALSGIGNKIAAKFGSGQATGRLETGNIANQLRKEFDVYIGKTGQEMDADSISQFLQSKGLPTDAVNSQASNTGQPAAQAQPKAATTNPQPTGRIDPTLDDPEAATDAPADNTAGNKAFGQMATQLSKPTDGAKPTATPAPTDGKLTPQQLAAKKAELLGRRKTGASAGTTQSGFGNYVKKASGERIVGANKDGSVRTVNIKAGMYDSISYESLREELFLTEALSKSQVDNIFKATAQLMAKQGMSMPGGAAQAPAGVQQGSGQSGAAQGGNAQQGGGDQSGGGVGGLAKSFAQGFKNTGKPSDFNKTQNPDQDFSGSLNFNQLSKLLPSTDPATLIRALKMVISGGKLTQQQLGVLGVAMTDIIKADPATTTKIMQSLKRISAE
jgi:hypothetical protein